MREPWIRVHARLIDKPVVSRLCRATGIKPVAAIGHLVTLWGSVAAHASNGAVQDVPDELLERWAAWTGRRGVFAKWLRQEHMDDTGRVREWDEYQGTLELRRQRDTERKAAWRERQRANATLERPTPVPVMSAGHPQDTTRDVGVTSDGRPVARNGTVRNGTERGELQEVLSTVSADAEPSGRAWLAPFLDLWTRRVGVVPAARAAKVIAPVRATYGDTDTLHGLTAYLDEPRHPDKPVKLEFFAADAARWIAEGKTPLVQDGQLTARGERVSRPT